MSGNGGELAVTYANMTDTAGQIKHAAEVVSGELQKMAAAVDNVSAGWEGQAHTAMTEAAADFRKRGERIKSALDQVAKLIERGSEHYQMTDSKAAKLFQI
ncbi:WXG100 family type VII secretion target [Streptomyces sp. NPDC052396]|uniref:WXG100 family type VII secretion target n=1 Tax=Streptomyces sp. NPDC052396 TaxID=3365689 RepID=UPI0037D603FF